MRKYLFAFLVFISASSLLGQEEDNLFFRSAFGLYSIDSKIDIDFRPAGLVDGSGKATGIAYFSSFHVGAFNQDKSMSFFGGLELSSGKNLEFTINGDVRSRRDRNT